MHSYTIRGTLLRKYPPKIRQQFRSVFVCVQNGALNIPITFERCVLDAFAPKFSSGLSARAALGRPRVLVNHCGCTAIWHVHSRESSSTLAHACAPIKLKPMYP